LAQTDHPAPARRLANPTGVRPMTTASSVPVWPRLSAA
jgi:hypothetical protein